jgi:hypothetical protein
VGGGFAEPTTPEAQALIIANMSDDLFERLKAMDDDDEYSLHLVSASKSGLDLQLEVELRDHSTGKIECWNVQCLSEREHVLQLGICQHDIELSSDHVLLWPHATPTLSLYFHGSTTDPATVVGALHACHISLSGGWFEFGRWFNSAPTLASLIDAGHGLLADGPEPLIKGYAQVMEQFGFRTSTLSRPPVYWEGASWTESIGPLVALVSRPTYVIAAEVRSQRVPVVKT